MSPEGPNGAMSENDGAAGVWTGLSFEANRAAFLTPAGPGGGSEARESLDAAITRGIAVYEAALQDWQGRDEEVAAGLAELPFALSAQEYREQEAFAVAQRVIAERYPAGPSANEADESAYAQDVEHLRLEIASTRHTRPPPQEIGGRHDAAEPDYGDVYQRQDADIGISID